MKFNIVNKSFYKTNTLITDNKDAITLSKRHLCINSNFNCSISLRAITGVSNPEPNLFIIHNYIEDIELFITDNEMENAKIISIIKNFASEVNIC